MLAADAIRFAPTFKDVGPGQPLLGCGTCVDRPICGGLHLCNTGSLLVSCMSYCTCEDTSQCDIVCPRKPAEYVKRHREVDGWDLTNIPIARTVELPHLPDWIALLQGNLLTDGRALALDDCMALPLTYALRGRGHATRARTRQELAQSYGVRPRRGWVLSGVQEDPAVERIWPLPDISRIARQLVHAGAIFATAPDFSTIIDSPRHDNLHAMKRIAWVWYHMTQGGLCTALHLNGRTDHDFVRWAEFIRLQPAVKAVAFEFLTGTATKQSANQYCKRLADLAASVGRDLTLVVRGNAEAAQSLRAAFNQVVFIDSTAYMRSTKRRRAYLNGNGNLSYTPVRTTTRREARALLRHNIQTLRTAATEPRLPTVPDPQAQLDFDALPADQNADHESSQLTLFPQQEA